MELPQDLDIPKTSTLSKIIIDTNDMTFSNTTWETHSSSSVEVIRNSGLTVISLPQSSRSIKYYTKYRYTKFAQFEI